jgi:hypothetical protein
MSDGETRIAYTGKSFIDARERQQNGEDNQVTAQQMQKWIDDIDDPNHQYAQSLKNTEDGDFFYALHICKENCKRINNPIVGGGSLTFVSEGWAGAAPHFKRRIGGTVDLCDGICDAKTIFENDNKLGENERAPNNPQMKNILRLKIDENNQPSIKKLFVEIVQWPQRIDDNTKEKIKDYLGNQLGNRISDSDYIFVNKEYDDYNQTEPRLSYVDGNLEANLWMKCFKKNSIRIFRHRGRMNRLGREKIGDFYEWIGEQKGGERNFKYDKNDLLLLWIPDKDDNCTDDSDWRDRCEDNVKIIIDELETDNPTKGSFKTFRNKKYKGFFILIGNRKEGEGDQVPFLKFGNPINRLFATLKESRRSNVTRRIPLYSFSQKEANMRITWLDGNNIFHARDDGLEHSLQSVDGEVSIIVSLNEIEEDQDNKFRTSIQLKLIDKNGLKPIKGNAFIVDGKNASISLRFKKKGDYRLLLKTSNSQYRKLHISVENDSGNPNSIYCQKEGWKKWSETKVVHRYVAEPKSQKKLMQKIIKQEYPKLNNYIEYNDSEWKKKKNRNGLMMEINRAAFQLIQEKTGKSYVDGGSWTRKTREIYSSIEWLHWPDMEDDERLEVPKIGVLQKRAGDDCAPTGVFEDGSYAGPEYDIDTMEYFNPNKEVKWKWGNGHGNHPIFSDFVEYLTENRGIIYSIRTLKQMQQNNFQCLFDVSRESKTVRPKLSHILIDKSKIFIDYETGFRFFEEESNMYGYKNERSEKENRIIGIPIEYEKKKIKYLKEGVNLFSILKSREIKDRAETFLFTIWTDIESFADIVDQSSYRDSWKRRRFSYHEREDSTRNLNLKQLARDLSEDKSRAERRLRNDWTTNISQAMGVDIDICYYPNRNVVPLDMEGLDPSQERYDIDWPNFKSISKDPPFGEITNEFYQKGGRRQLFLELEYYDSNDIGDEVTPVNLYLGCLYNIDYGNTPMTEKMFEKRIKIASYRGWEEDRNELWVDLKNREIDFFDIEKRESNISNLLQVANTGSLNSEVIDSKRHLSWNINSFSDTRYVEREVLRAFRSIYESENNITTDPTKTGGKDIPGFLFDEKYREWLWNVRIDGLSRCFPNEYDSEQIEKVKLNYQKRILKRLWWNVDES